VSKVGLADLAPRRALASSPKWLNPNANIRVGWKHPVATPVIGPSDTPVELTTALVVEGETYKPARGGHSVRRSLRSQNP
jgi:hypothetical protein